MSREGVMAQESERRPTARPHSRTIHRVPGRSQAPASAANNPMNGHCRVKFPPVTPILGPRPHHAGSSSHPRSLGPPRWLLFWLLDTRNPCLPRGLGNPSSPCWEPPTPSHGSPHFAAAVHVCFHQEVGPFLGFLHRT